MNDFQILVVEDDAQLREAIVDTLKLHKIACFQCPSAEAAMQLLKKQNVNMILSDISMGEMSGFDLLEQVRKNYPAIPVVLMTAFGEVEKAVQAIQLGAMDYLVKPFEVDVLVDTVNQFRNQAQAPFDLDEPVAQAPSSKALFKLAEQVAGSEATVMISGDSGTGKEVLARFIHQNSPRKKGPFVAINCAAIPENMMEATLFGYEKGAFTGAYNAMPGKFEQAQGGTLLLDEISEMDIGLQAKLLRVLQEREVERLGGRKIIKLDVRVLATTNRNLVEYVNEKKFREDLYYRLSVFPLHWQSLAQRREDIVPIAQRLLHKHCKKQNLSQIILDDSAMEKLRGHSWPGNVRELDNVMQRALIIHSGHKIGAGDIVLNLMPGIVNHASPSQPAVTVSSIPLAVPSGPPNELPPEAEQDAGDALGDNLKQREYVLILDALKNEKNKKRAAQKLGISPRTLRYKMARMRDQGIDITDSAPL
ncbi:MAG: sigma-54 dependent transcriptional regulator [Bermanella sp.]